MFRELGIADRILTQVRNHTMETEAWLYVFSHYSLKAKRRILDGLL